MGMSYSTPGPSKLRVFLNQKKRPQEASPEAVPGSSKKQPAEEHTPARAENDCPAKWFVKKVASD